MAIATNIIIIVLIVSLVVIMMLAILVMILIRRRRNRNRVSDTKMKSLTLVPRVSLKHKRSMSEFSFREKNRVIGRNGSLTRSHSIRRSDSNRFSFPSNAPLTPIIPEELERRDSQQKKGESRRFSVSVTVPVELVKPITRTYQLKNESHQFTYTSNLPDEPLPSTIITTNEMANV